jgi:hypothetical protein
MSDTTLPPRRALYFLDHADLPPMVLTQAHLDAMDADEEGVALVAGIHDRKQQA